MPGSAKSLKSESVPLYVDTQTLYASLKTIQSTANTIIHGLGL